MHSCTAAPMCGPCAANVERLRATRLPAFDVWLGEAHLRLAAVSRQRGIEHFVSGYEGDE